MRYRDLVDVYERLESLTGRLAMTDVVAGFLAGIGDDDLPTVLLHLQGTALKAGSDRELGLADNLMIRSLSQVSGASEASVKDSLRETGDLGATASDILVTKPQTTLTAEPLTLAKVQANLEKMATLAGKGSQERKRAYLAELLSMADPQEAKYLVRLVLGQLRLGVGAGIIRDAIAKAYDVPAAAVERAYNLTTDYGRVAAVAKKDGETGLAGISLTPGKPVKVMLAQKAADVATALEGIEDPAFEYKYDGMRVQAHKNGDDVVLFTRRLENVTCQFPDIAGEARRQVRADSAILEGEVVAIRGADDRRPRPFQDLSRRIKRKYDIERIAADIPAEANLFDLLYKDGRTLVDEPFERRRALLEQTVSPTRSFRLAEQLRSRDRDAVESFYAEALAAGHEGVMAKNQKAPYQPGSRVGYMYKIKPVMESLDLVITGATWGEGRRAHWLGSFWLSVRDEGSGDLLAIGRMATGLTDEQFAEMTARLRPLVTCQEGKDVTLLPEVVVEVAYEEIQRSPTYSSGYALRFPRLVCVRDDLGVEEADTVGRVESLLDGRG